MLGVICAGACSSAMLLLLVCDAAGAYVLARGVGVAAPESVPRGSGADGLKGVGSMTLVRLGKGELGSEGGSWMCAGVWAVSSDMVSGGLLEWRPFFGLGSTQLCWAVRREAVWMCVVDALLVG